MAPLLAFLLMAALLAAAPTTQGVPTQGFPEAPLSSPTTTCAAPPCNAATTTHGVSSSRGLPRRPHRPPPRSAPAGSTCPPCPPCARCGNNPGDPRSTIGPPEGFVAPPFPLPPPSSSPVKCLMPPCNTATGLLVSQTSPPVVSHTTDSRDLPTRRIDAAEIELVAWSDMA
ncbi:hypothetical protein ACP70R_008918 [Stipagrostis hirtigluma subsp. patula]